MTKAILGIAPTMMSLKLAGEMLPKKIKSCPKGQRKACTEKQVKGFVGSAAKVLVGIPLIKEVSTQVEGF